MIKALDTPSSDFANISEQIKVALSATFSMGYFNALDVTRQNSSITIKAGSLFEYKGALCNVEDDHILRVTQDTNVQFICASGDPLNFSIERYNKDIPPVFNPAFGWMVNNKIILYRFLYLNIYPDFTDSWTFYSPISNYSSMFMNVIKAYYVLCVKDGKNYILISTGDPRVWV